MELKAALVVVPEQEGWLIPADQWVTVRQVGPLLSQESPDKGVKYMIKFWMQILRGKSYL